MINLLKIFFLSDVHLYSINIPNNNNTSRLAIPSSYNLQSPRFPPNSPSSTEWRFPQNMHL